MSFSAGRRVSIRKKLVLLYGDRADETLERLERLADGFRDRLPRSAATGRLWSERDVVLITYADMVSGPTGSPLANLDRFLLDERLDSVLSAVHLLPFFPSSSDDGFSVIDYRGVDLAVGIWDDVAQLGRTFELMFDLVLNHCSQRSGWFQDYLRGDSTYDRHFIESDPADPALAMVTRPRSLPLLTEFETSRGRRHVWTTFSADQVDLNFAEPSVLIEMCDVLLDYVRRGAKIIRLDAIAYLWKRLGTNCIHLPETHAVVKLMRDLLDELAPGTLLLTETNVPHAENVSYFGDGDEAHLVYQFSLAPLLLDAFLAGDPTPLNAWLRDLEPAAPGTTYFNFTASHDGIGVRPLEGLVSSVRRDRLVEAVLRRGGRVSMKRNADGSDSPYELNITWFSALGDPDEVRSNGDERQIARFLASQAVMLALRGIPGIYFHSLIGTPNWTAGVAETGRVRTINRRKFTRKELDETLEDPATPQAMVFAGYRRLLAVRIEQPAFHPDADQTVVPMPTGGVIAFMRASRDGGQRVLVLCNVTGRPVTPDLLALSDFGGGTDLITGQQFDPASVLDPFRAVWLELT